MREVIGARGGVGGGAACNAEANAVVDGSEEEDEYAEEDDGAASNGMASRFREDVLERGKVRDDDGMLVEG